MALTIPALQSITNGSNGFDIQTVQDPTDIAASALAIAGTGVYSGGQVTAQGSPNMTVQVSALWYTVNGSSPILVAADTSLTIAAADSTDRRDIVVYTPGTGFQAITGTDCGTAGWVRTSTGLPPIKPAIPAGSVILGEVVVTSSTTSIAAINIVDKTCLLIPDPIAVAQYAPSSAGSYTPVAITTGVSALDTTNLKVTFPAPPSGKVNVMLQAFVQGPTTAAGNSIYFAVVSTTGSPGTLVGVVSRVYDSPVITTAADDQQMCSMEQVITGLTPGTSYTWYFAAAATNTSGKIIPQGGATNTTAATGGPAIIEITAA